jgi:hypothetical protein
MKKVVINLHDRLLKRTAKELARNLTSEPLGGGCMDLDDAGKMSSHGTRQKQAVDAADASSRGTGRAATPAGGGWRPVD